MILTPHDAQSIADEMKTVIHQDITIMDDNGIIIASTDPSRIGNSHIGAQKILKEKLNFLTIAKDDPEHGVRAGINMPITVDDRAVGVMCVTGNPERVTMFGDIIRRMTGIMLENIRSREQRVLQEQAKRIFVENWLSSSDINEEQFRRGELFGFVMTDSYKLALMPAADDSGDTDEVKSEQIVQFISELIGQRNGNYCCSMRGCILIMQSEKNRKEDPSMIHRVMAEATRHFELSQSCGFAIQREGESMHQCYLNAQTALRVSMHSEKRLPVEYDATSPLFLAESLPESLLHAMEYQVFNHCTQDEIKEFSRLVHLYFRCAGSLNKCADELYVHRNTVQYRIDNLLKKTGFDLRKPYDAMVLFFSVSGIKE